MEIIEINGSGRYISALIFDKESDAVSFSEVGLRRKEN